MTTTPAYVADREALARVLAEHSAVATGLGEWACRCSPREWRSTAHRSTHMADALIASGVVQTPGDFVAKILAVVESYANSEDKVTIYADEREEFASALAAALGATR